jgi:hypothetical protein
MICRTLAAMLSLPPAPIVLVKQKQKLNPDSL